MTPRGLKDPDEVTKATEAAREPAPEGHPDAAILKMEQERQAGLAELSRSREQIENLEAVVVAPRTSAKQRAAAKAEIASLEEARDKTLYPRVWKIEDQIKRAPAHTLASVKLKLQIAARNDLAIDPVALESGEVVELYEDAEPDSVVVFALLDIMRIEAAQHHVSATTGPDPDTDADAYSGPIGHMTFAAPEGGPVEHKSTIEDWYLTARVEFTLMEQVLPIVNSSDDEVERIIRADDPERYMILCKACGEAQDRAKQGAEVWGAAMARMLIVLDRIGRDDAEHEGKS